MKKTIGLFLILFMLSYATEAKVVLSPLIADGMVLQRDASVKIWGETDPAKAVTVIPSWNGEKYTATSDKEGKWEVDVRTTGAGGPYTIRISDGEETVLRDILLGDVWVCAGQSNMQMSIQGDNGQHVEGALDAVMESGKYSNIRILSMKPRWSKIRQEEVTGTWQRPSIVTTPYFGAVSYFFAQYLYDILQVPIGILNAGCGGSPIEGWLQAREVSCYNGMIHPLKRLSVKGFTWYQGESSVAIYKEYPSLFAKMVDEWRHEFQYADEAPFYFVQITPYKYDRFGGKDGDRSAFLREAQMKCLSVPHTGMVVSLDAGAEFVMHPSKKKEIGQRLACQALAKTYHLPVPCDGPFFKGATVKGNRMVITFDNLAGGLCPLNTDLEGFELAGADGKYRPASARVSKRGQSVEVWSEKVPAPEYVRYGFKNYTEGSLYNTFGLPAAPFRTDDFDPVK